MKFAAVVAGAGVAGILLVSNLQGSPILPMEGRAAETLVDPMTTASVSPAPAAEQKMTEAIRLIDLRTGATCKMPRPTDLGTHFTPAPVGPDCSDVPLTRDVSQWRSSPDGSLEMADSNGRTLYRFIPGDGVLFESVYPSNALVTIVPARS